MSEDRDTTQEYDQKHGAPKGYEPGENDTGPASAPIHRKPSPVQHGESGVK